MGVGANIDAYPPSLFNFTAIVKVGAVVFTDSTLIVGLNDISLGMDANGEYV